MMSRELSSSGTISSAPEHHHTTGNPDGRAHELRSEGLGGVRNGGVSVAEEMDFAPDESYIYLGAGGKRSNGGGGARYKSLSPARLPIAARSQPCLTIPPGLSPTSLLLESPVLLTNVKAEPSPTTGTFSIPSTMNDNVPSDTLSSPRDSCNNSTYDEGSSGDFEFKPYVRLCSTSGPLSMGTLDSASSKQQQIEPFAQDQSQCQSQAVVSSCLVKPENAVVSSHESTLSVKDPKPASEIVRSPSIAASSVSAPYEISSDVLQQAKDSENVIQASEVDHKENGPLVVIEKSSEDGYNWRKYGQKLVKGSEFPRSYYKCTHPNCQMKKHLERSRDGQITDIIYIGSHDHPKPQPSRRLAVGAILLSQGEERVNGFFGCAENNAQRPTSNNISLNGTPELCPASASDDDVECTGGQSSIPAGDIVDDDDPESKRRKKDDGSVDVLPMGKTREPRVVVQTLSEVDILDDGYRWRKYGQKVVKGNPNPRSYYKCTNAGCPVRKHVERASHDPKAVITTYEGKHNHDVPAARTSSSSSHDHTTSATVIVNDTAGSHLSGGTMNNSIMMRTCGTLKATSCQYERSEEEFDTISLDLGVGINSPRQDERANNEKQQQTPEIIEQIHNSQMRLGAGSGCDRRRLVIQAVPISAGYVISPKNNNSIDCYGSTREVDKRGESFSFKAAPPLNHSSSTYQANTLEDCF